MSLTGSFFLGAVLLVTLASFVGLVVIWPRLAGRSPWGVGGRVVGLVLVNLMVLLTAATQLNAKYLFFADWSDLAGSFTGHLTQTGLDRGGEAGRAVHADLRGPRAIAPATVPALKATPTASGLLSFTVHGQLSGITASVVVWLPPDYSSSESTGKRYPVMEAFNGYPGSPYGWFKVMGIVPALERQAQRGSLRLPIVVAPQIEVPEGVDTEGVNGTAGRPQLETWLTRDVPDWLASTFRVESSRDSWATIGFSAGGWDAAMATVLHPAQYGASIVLGGYFQPSFSPLYEPYPPSSSLTQHYDLVQDVRQRPPPVAMWVETSHKDPLSYSTTSRFLAATRAPLSVHAVILRNAGHRIGVWRALLPESLRWLGAIHGFRP